MSKTMKVEHTYEVAARTGLGFEVKAGDLISDGLLTIKVLPP